MNNGISVFVFDLGNVLIPFDYNRIINSLNEIDSGLGERFYKRYKESYHVHRDFERWKLSTAEFTEIMLDWLERKVAAEEFCRIYGDLFTVNEKMVQLLQRLKRKYKLVMLSNTNYIHQKYGWEKFDFLKLFDKWILSHEVGAIKPEAEIYKSVEEFSGEPAERHFFTDDVQEYIDAASRRGWRTMLFESEDKFLREFRTQFPEAFDETA